jgi:6-phosphogluconate dehydrogenase
MKVGMVGLGRMGANMAIRLLQGEHEVVGYDANPYAVAVLEGQGAVGASSLASLVGELQPPRAVCKEFGGHAVGREGRAA